MRFKIPFHPILIAAFPILSLYSANVGMFEISDIWESLELAIAVAVAAWICIGLAWRNVERGAMGSSTLVLSYVIYSRVFHAPLDAAPLATWAAATLVAAWLVSWKWQGTQVLNVLGSFLILSVVGSVAYQAVHTPPIHHEGELPVRGSNATDTSPDVYYIILDGYGRHDSLQQFIQYSNSDFLEALKKRGFYVADQSHSNYVQTEISIPSSLNMNFIPTLLPHVLPTDGQRASLNLIAKDNEAKRQFTARGYKSTAVGSGFPPFDRLPADFQYRPFEDKSLFESTLSQSSPLASEKSDSAMYSQRRQQLITAFNNLKRMAGRRAQPRFVFAHILAPHPPFVFDAKGNAIRPPYPFGLWDGSDFVTAGQTRDDYRRGYAGQVQTINRLVLDTIDTILSKPGVRPVIILQGDHGSKRFLDQNDLSKTDVRECFSNLFAIEAPAEVTKLLYPSITPVNELRVVLNGLFNAQLPLLADKSWYSPYDKPYRFTDVTKPVVEYSQSSNKSTH